MLTLLMSSSQDLEQLFSDGHRLAFMAYFPPSLLPLASLSISFAIAYQWNRWIGRLKLKHFLNPETVDLVAATETLINHSPKLC